MSGLYSNDSELQKSLASGFNENNERDKSFEYEAKANNKVKDYGQIKEGKSGNHPYSQGAIKPGSRPRMPND